MQKFKNDGNTISDSIHTSSLLWIIIWYSISAKHFQLEVIYRDWLSHFPSAVCHLTFWCHHVMKVQMRLVRFRYVFWMSHGSQLEFIFKLVLTYWCFSSLSLREKTYCLRMDRFQFLGGKPLKIHQQCRYFLIIMQYLEIRCPRRFVMLNSLDPQKFVVSKLNW